jgi:hypothetical protein
MRFSVISNRSEKSQLRELASLGDSRVELRATRYDTQTIPQGNAEMPKEKHVKEQLEKSVCEAVHERRRGH